ncbi:hypothetical protein E2C01_003239 [Portunus trituberculatus]|uniref:Uncharacterized protein n=1 Tax=Portunus trituberculatus TaxID=210409 RepID=A0A5B7CLN9_PORTR|nr:hypothetical protein [Portunus trituberculatus]
MASASILTGCTQKNRARQFIAKTYIASANPGHENYDGAGRPAALISTVGVTQHRHALLVVGRRSRLERSRETGQAREETPTLRLSS